jgi:hypothetical protein
MKGSRKHVTTDPSRIPHMFVISRNTAFAYQGKRVETSRSGANWRCAMCSKAASAGRATGSVSMLN